ncbi:unnamed protein product [Ectocarpus sp. 12 AP-2014]
MAATGRNFSIIHEKLLHCRLVCMCPTMDLVASLHVDGQLSVHRTMGWQRSFTLTQEDMGNRTFSCVTWSPNGKTLAVGYTDGTIQLFGVETGAEECSLAFHEGRSLAALTWVAQQPRHGTARSRADEEADQLAEVAAAYADRCEHVLGPCDQLPGANGARGGGVAGRSSEYSSQADDGFMLLQGMKERPVSVLASADSAGVVVLSICGAYRLITIDLRAHRKPTKGKGRASGGGRVDSPRQRRSRRSPGQDGAGFSGLTENEVDFDGTGPALRPLQLTLSADLSVLTALVEFDGQVELIQVDLPLLWRQRHELKPLAMQFTAFRAVIGRLVASVPRLPQLWKGTLQALETKLGNLEDLLPRFGYDKDITAKDEFIHLVTCGYASAALTQFLSTGLTHVQLARMRKAVDTGTGQVEAMLRGDVSLLARTLLFRACDLHRLVIACTGGGGVDGDGGLGLGQAPVEAFLKDCEMLCVKVEQTLRDVQTSRSRLRFLLLWLEQMSPVVTDSDSADGTEEHEPPSPCLTLANSVLTILREPLPSDKHSPSSRSTAAGASPRSRVESMIGTRVPGLAVDENQVESLEGPPAARGPLTGPNQKNRFIVLPEDPLLASRTLQGQVQRLWASVGEVFQAPRNRLSRAVANVTCARLCPSSEGGAGDLIRTRAAARAAAAASGGAPPLVSMRACMGFHDKLPAGCVDVGERDRRESGGVVAVTVVPDNTRGGKGLDVVWVTVVPTPLPSLEGSNVAVAPRDSMWVTGVRSPPGFQVRQVAFYGSVPGVPTQNEGRLAIVLEPLADRHQATALHLLDLHELDFTKVGSLASFDDHGLASPARKARGSGGSKDVIGVARGQGVDTPHLTELSSRSRELPGYIKGVAVALSGARGTACAVSSSKHLIVFDLEEDEDGDDEQDGEE